VYPNVLKTTHLDLGGPLPKPMNLCCYIEYVDLNPSFEHNSEFFSKLTRAFQKNTISHILEKMQKLSYLRGSESEHM
jgi:hypothetical protein